MLLDLAVVSPMSMAMTLNFLLRFVARVATVDYAALLNWFRSVNHDSK